LNRKEPSSLTSDPRSWAAASIDSCKSWYYPLPAECLAVFDQVGQDSPTRHESPSQITLPEALRRSCAAALEPVRGALEAGRGFAILHGPSDRQLAAADAQLLYWIVGQGLGTPFAQNVQGNMFYDVRDTGQDLAKGARFSVTNYESSFHTDNSFGTEILDYVGLLCLQTAKSGGRSQVLSGLAVYNELASRHPDLLQTLSQPFHIDRRGGIREGETPTIAFPVVHWDGKELLFRYLRYWIEAGHDKIGQPLTPQQVKALDTLDETMRRPDLRVEFDLAPGQMYFINNRWILHNRTAFEDYPELERRRHLVRLWLRK
jgi:alpha-ketoglutarate-dependent taurine dioxygenase